jgi:cell fate regulator YaaT (PSP1 superfamily)
MPELYIVGFKGSRREYYYNTYYHALHPRDHVIIQAEQGEHIGVVMTKIDKDVDFSDTVKPRSVLRPATDDDMIRYLDLKAREIQYRGEIIELVAKHGLPMKIVDVECQFDGNKITFYFTADHRVDFRALVRDLAARYRTRIELRQIGVRDEARRMGGYGVCGRRQCCNTHIRDFAPISTQHARDQDLTLNPSKISGNCGRLLCCLRYEADLYTTCKKAFPRTGTEVATPKGNGVIERIDVFNEEAVIRGPDNTVFSVSASEIESTRAAEREKPDRRDEAADFRAKEPVDVEDEEALRRLDEPEE